MVILLLLRITPLVKAQEDEEEFVIVENGKSSHTDESLEADKSAHKSTSFDFWFSVTGDFKGLTKKIGEQIDVDPDFLRLFVITQNNTRLSLKRDQNFRKLLDRVPKSQTVEIQYEVLKVTLSQFEEMVLYQYG
ncbi:unnamed protein product [Ambrosiozyma monospora]|uniref:Unnamed protein product n=1 Tax=Ambrosiozyma monospora TaxID=43982 RepID=A0A9W6T6C4_AMBMO|nr:unnamed protein product [Ambrosiozyma monospora]